MHEFTVLIVLLILITHQATAAAVTSSFLDEVVQNAVVATPRRALTPGKPLWLHPGAAADAPGAAADAPVAAGAAAAGGSSPTSSDTASNRRRRALLQATSTQDENTEGLALEDNQQTAGDAQDSLDGGAAGPDASGQGRLQLPPPSLSLPNFRGTKQLDALIRIADALDPSQSFLPDWTYNATLANETEITYHCLWQGVVCGDGSNNVREIRLPGRGLNGSLPPGDALAVLPALAAIDLSNNRLTGPLPDGWGVLQQLRGIYLSNCQLSGEIPQAWEDLDLIDLELGVAQGQTGACVSNRLSGLLPPWLAKMTRLAYLSLACNEFSGSLPDSWGGALLQVRTVSLHDNNLSGPLPLSWQNMTKLEILALHSNQLTGSVPEWTGFAALRYLFLGRNSLSGPAASVSHLAKLPKLQVVTLQQNGLSGALSAGLAASASIRGIYLRSNKITGPLPSEWGRFKALEVLALSGNPLAATLPDAWSSMASLKQLVMMGCSLAGQLPSSWGAGLQQLTQLVLSDNALAGSLPSAWFATGAFPKLEVMNLASNRLSGSMPASYGLASLSTLVLSSNLLTSQLPSGLAALPVASLHLSKNKFSSTLPAVWNDGFGNLTTLTLAEAGITGGFPDWSSMSLRQLDLQNNRLSGPLPQRLFENASSLALNGNEFSGTIPLASWGASKLPLRQLDLTSNKLSGNIDPGIAGLTKLQGLALSRNRIEGALPLQPGLLDLKDSLTVLLLDRNKLSGTLDVGLRVLANLRLLRLDSNLFSGILPEQLPPENGQDKMGWRSLQELFLHNNSFSGALPGAWQRMYRLRTLSLHSNSLSRRIPEEWGEFGELSRLYLSDNQLTGQLPESLGQVVTLTDVRIMNNRLSGALPWDAANLTRLHTLWLSGNSFQSSLPRWANLGALRSLRLAGRMTRDGSCVVAARTGGLTGSLTGGIPRDWALTMPRLQALSLGCQQLTEGLEALSGMSTLQELQLQHNQLAGLPKLTGMSSLVTLVLNHNQLAGGVQQALGTEPGQLASLQRLVLHHNPGLAGCIPKRFQARLALASQIQQQDAFWAATRITGFCQD